MIERIGRIYKRVHFALKRIKHILIAFLPAFELANFCSSPHEQNLFNELKNKSKIKSLTLRSMPEIMQINSIWHNSNYVQRLGRCFSQLKVGIV